jgi:hypothetical protein
MYNNAIPTYHRGERNYGTGYDMMNRIDELEAKAKQMQKALHEAEITLALVEKPAMPDPDYQAEITQLGRRIGFGALMSGAQAGWERSLSHAGLSGGEHVAGPSRNIVLRALQDIRAALEDKP